jgi:hypothetical protein
MTISAPNSFWITTSIGRLSSIIGWARNRKSRALVCPLKSGPP